MLGRVRADVFRGWSSAARATGGIWIALFGRMRVRGVEALITAATIVTTFSVARSF